MVWDSMGWYRSRTGGLYEKTSIIVIRDCIGNTFDQPGPYATHLIEYGNIHKREEVHEGRRRVKVPRGGTVSLGMVRWALRELVRKFGGGMD